MGSGGRLFGGEDGGLRAQGLGFRVIRWLGAKSNPKP